LRSHLLVLSVLAVALLSVFSADTHALGIYSAEFVASYTINDATGAITYTEQGTLQRGLLCPGTWLVTNQSTTSVLDSSHQYRVGINSSAGVYIIEEQVALQLTHSELTCSVLPETALLSDGTDCTMSGTWSPRLTDSPTGTQSGWLALNRSPNSTATLAEQPSLYFNDLNHHAMRIKYYPGTAAAGVPFTGRLYFTDPVTGNDLYWHNYLGGHCLPSLPVQGDGVGSPHSCCTYAATNHLVEFSAEATGFKAKPIGSWSMGLEVCDVNCG